MTARPKTILRENPVEECPSCGGHQMERVPEEEWGDQSAADPAFGLMRCKTCHAVSQAQE